MLIGRIHRCVDTKVDADAKAHELLAVKCLSDLYRRVGVEEGDYYATEGLEWRPCVHSGMLIDCFADLSESR